MLGSRRGSNASRTASPMKISSVSTPPRHEECGEPQPRRLQIASCLRDQFAQRGRSGRQAEAEKIQRRQQGHRSGQDERQIRQRRHHRVRQDVPPHHDDVRHPKRLRGADIFEVAAAQELGAHQSGQVHPAEQQQEHQQHPEAGRDDAGEDDQQIEFRHAAPDLDEALEQKIGQPAIVALHRAGDHADDRGDRRQREAEQHRQAKPVDDACQNIARLVVRAQQIAPRGWRWRRARQVLHRGCEAVRDRGPDHPAMGFDRAAADRDRCSRPRSA